MILFIIGSGVITLFAILLCLFSGQQQRKEDAWLIRQDDLYYFRKKSAREREDWDVLNNWDDD